MSETRDNQEEIPSEPDPTSMTRSIDTVDQQCQQEQEALENKRYDDYMFEYVVFYS